MAISTTVHMGDSVAGQVALFVVLEDQLLAGNGPAWTASTVQDIVDSLGLTPKPMAHLGWVIGSRRAAHSKPSRERRGILPGELRIPSARDRLYGPPVDLEALKQAQVSGVCRRVRITPTGVPVAVWSTEGR